MKHYAKAALLGLAVAAALIIITNPAMGQQPMPQGTPIQLLNEEQTQFQLLLLRQENLRLAVCLRAGVSADECGGWGNGFVTRLPKKAEPQAVTQPAPAAKPPEKAQAAPPVAAPKQ